MRSVQRSVRVNNASSAPRADLIGRFELENLVVRRRRCVDFTELLVDRTDAHPVGMRQRRIGQTGGDGLVQFDKTRPRFRNLRRSLDLRTRLFVRRIVRQALRRAHRMPA